MKISKWKLHAYITVLLLITNSPLMWKCFILIPDYIFKGFFLFWCLLGAFQLKSSISNRFWEALLAIFFYLVFYIVGSRYDVGGCILNLLLTSIVLYAYSYMLIKSNKFHYLCEAFVNVLCVIASVSLFFWFFGSILDMLPFSAEIYYSWGNENNLSKTYLYLYFENYVQNQNLLGLTIPRNCGIFPEAPGYSEFLLFAIGIAWFAENWKINKKQLYLLIITLLSTQSTKAIVTLLVVFVVKFLIDNRKVKNLSMRGLKILCGIILAGVSLIVLYVIIQNKMGTASYIVRMDDFNAAIKTWQLNKIFGTGYENDISIIKNITTSWLRHNNGLTMGLAILLAEGGIVLLIYYLGAFIAGLKSKLIVEKKNQYLLFTLLFFLNLLASNTVFRMNTLLIINSAYAVYICGKDK